MSLLNQLTIIEAHRGLMKKKFSCQELARACLNRIEEVDPQIKAFITVTEDLALNQAKEVDKKIVQGKTLGILEGIPVAIKDIFCTQGIKTTAASKILENYVPPYDATVVRKLKEAGAVILGKTNLDEFAMGSSTENSGFFPTKNPWDLERVPGGSSGGSAAAVAADECPYSLGTDTGGSIREPASFCGITGLKVTYGRVSRYGVLAYASSFDTIGPLTKTVEDTALVLQIIAGHDPLDSTTPKVGVPDYFKNLNQPIKNLKIGIPKEYFVQGMDPSVEKIVKQAIKKFEELGAEIIEISLPLTKYAIATYYILVKSEASTNLARYDGVKYGLSAKAISLLENYLQTRQQGFGPEVKRSIMMGTYTLSAGYYDAYYLKAAKVRALIKKEFEDIFRQVDCLMTPVAPTVAFKLGEKISDPLTMYLADIFTVPINIAGLPAISVPCGFTKPSNGQKELPVGLQIIGPQFSEEKILQVTYNFQKATNYYQRKPDLP